MKNSDCFLFIYFSTKFSESIQKWIKTSNELHVWLLKQIFIKSSEFIINNSITYKKATLVGNSDFIKIFIQEKSCLQNSFL